MNYLSVALGWILGLVVVVAGLIIFALWQEKESLKTALVLKNIQIRQLEQNVKELMDVIRVQYGEERS